MFTGTAIPWGLPRARGWDAQSVLALTRWNHKGNHPQRLGVAAEPKPLSPAIREHSVRDVREALMVARNTEGKLVRR
ncbi:MAG TPA: hypothetical protein VFD99_08120, partial [Arthrobacter sp.]|nr:hypothetical protein [Arthrobacter sp.]